MGTKNDAEDTPGGWSSFMCSEEDQAISAFHASNLQSRSATKISLEVDVMAMYIQARQDDTSWSGVAAQLHSAAGRSMRLGQKSTVAEPDSSGRNSQDGCMGEVEEPTKRCREKVGPLADDAGARRYICDGQPGALDFPVGPFAGRRE
jgi:hypothetical protein